MASETLARIVDLIAYYDEGERELREFPNGRPYGDPTGNSEKQMRRVRKLVATVFPRPEFERLIARFRAADFAIVPSALGDIAAVKDAGERERLIKDAIAHRWGQPQIQLEKRRRKLIQPRTAGRSVRRSDGVREAVARLDATVETALKHLAAIREALGTRALAEKVAGAEKVLESLLADARARGA